MKLLVVDDEPLARQRLCRMLRARDSADDIREAVDGLEALELNRRFEPDVVLLDIRMPGMDGIEAARHLGALEEPPAVIFTTAYDEYALAAFETEAVGYLLKPVRREKLARAVRHAARLAGPQLARLAEQSQLGKRRSQICARLGEQLRLVPLGDVLYFHAGQKYVTLRHHGGRELIDESLRALEQEFAPDFIRIHRNSLVARRYVQAVERGPEGHLLVRLKDCEETLQVSRRHAAEALRQIRTGN
jgi:two-component system response regulator AlgR